jgi:uncharacterized protein
VSAEGQQEQSMEDILASIRKILSEDYTEAAKPEPSKAAPPQPPTSKPVMMEPDEEPSFNPEPDMPLQLTDSMMVKMIQQQEHHYEPAPSYDPAQPNNSYGDHVVSDPVAAASGASIAQLAQAVARERAVALGNHGLTLEQLVREICTPILKHWLDSNLPYMVERIVKQEIERIATRSDRS